MNRIVPLFAAVSIAIAAPATISAQGESARATLVTAAFQTGSKSTALSLVNKAIGSLNSTLKASPGDRDALLQQGIAYGYRGKLNKSIGDAKKGRQLLETFARKYPSDPEAQIALGGWHMTVIGDVGSLVGSTALGASKSKGKAALSKAVSLGGNRAFFPAYAGMSRIALDADDAANAKTYLVKASRGSTPQEVDRITKKSAARVLALINAGKNDEASKLAEQLLPFGRVS